MNTLIENNTHQRRCGICKVVKLLNLENFHSEKSRPLGFSYNCKPCEKIRSKKKYLANPRAYKYSMMTKEQKDRKLQWGVKYRKTDKGRAISMICAYRNIDRKNGHQSDLTQDFLINNIFNKSCVYCGDTENLGCDRVDNSKGHLKINVIPSCGVCNITRMNNFSVDEMKLIGEAIKKIKLNRLNYEI